VSGVRVPALLSSATALSFYHNDSIILFRSDPHLLKKTVAMRPFRKSGRPSSAPQGSSDLTRSFNALILLLEEKGVLEPGELEDTIMNIKVQLGDQIPNAPAPAAAPRKTSRKQRPTQNTAKKGPDYIGPERRDENSHTVSKERRNPDRAPMAHVSGSVTLSETNQPVNGVQLILRRNAPGDRPIQFRSTKSDMHGRFIFLNLPLSSLKQGDIEFIYHIEVRYRNQTVDVSRALVLEQDQTTSHTVQLPGETKESA
jgi:hypothetical protein